MESIDELCAQLAVGGMSRAAFVEACVKFTCRQIHCSRVGLWIFIEGEQGLGLRLRCLGMYDRHADQMCQVPDESEEKSAPYFAELERVGHVMADDARSHPATRSFFNDHLREKRVQSLMAASFSLNGKLVGAFTCTAVGAPVHWTKAQLATLRRIGTRVTLALAGASPRQLDSFWAPLP